MPTAVSVKDFALEALEEREAKDRADTEHSNARIRRDRELSAQRDREAIAERQGRAIERIRRVTGRTLFPRRLDPGEVEMASDRRETRTVACDYAIVEGIQFVYLEDNRAHALSTDWKNRLYCSEPDAPVADWVVVSNPVDLGKWLRRRAAR